MKVIDINNWNRKKHYMHFMNLNDPYFAVTIPFDVTKAYNYSKKNNISFFGKYLHDCMLAINSVENFKYRIDGENIVECDLIHASPTIMREDFTFGFSFVHFSDDLSEFLKNLNEEKKRINNSLDLYPPINSFNCVHCSAMPWFSFTGHKEPKSGLVDSIPKLAFAKAEKVEGKLMMNVSINVNHALIDGYHVWQFSEKFQYFLKQY